MSSNSAPDLKSTSSTHLLYWPEFGLMMDTLRHLHNPLRGNSRPIALALPQEPATRDLDLEEPIKHLALISHASSSLYRRGSCPIPDAQMTSGRGPRGNRQMVFLHSQSFKISSSLFSPRRLVHHAFPSTCYIIDTSVKRFTMSA